MSDVRRHLASALVALFTLGLLGSPPNGTAGGDHHPDPMAAKPEAPRQESDAPVPHGGDRHRCPGICFCLAQCGASDLSQKTAPVPIPRISPVEAPATVRDPVAAVATLLPYATGPPGFVIPSKG